ncbi:MAG: dihydrodipicolinate reductase [Deltaproteobacteria bacterium]|nr:dihydrodipicolinate reductase [Deltaproteobacteria bacterium]
MQKIPIMINGLPGNVAQMLARHALSDNRFSLVPFSLTGPEISDSVYESNGAAFKLIRPQERDSAVEGIKAEFGEFIAVDFTHPSAVEDNTRFYCNHDIFFVMGTTGGDRLLLAKLVEQSNISAVIAPNMAKQIVGFQAMVAHAAEQFPGLFTGYSLEINESHQSAKADTSGTAKAVAGYFNKMGIDFSEDRITKIRDINVQQKELGVPKAYLNGHAWHTYTLVSPDKSVLFKFTHNINGRDIYADGTLDATGFLHKKIGQNVHGHVYSMIDVLKGS